MKGKGRTSTAEGGEAGENVANPSASVIAVALMVSTAASIFSGAAHMATGAAAGAAMGAGNQ